MGSSRSHSEGPARGRKRHRFGLRQRRPTTEIRMSVEHEKGERYVVIGCILLLCLGLVLTLRTHQFKYRAQLWEADESSGAVVRDGGERMRLRVSRRDAQYLSKASFVEIDFGNCLGRRTARLVGFKMRESGASGRLLPVLLELEMMSPPRCSENPSQREVVILASETYLKLFAESFIRR